MFFAELAAFVFVATPQACYLHFRAVIEQMLLQFVEAVFFVFYFWSLSVLKLVAICGAFKNLKLRAILMLQVYDVVLVWHDFDLSQLR